MLLPLENREFAGGPVVNNPPWNAEATGLIPGQATKILNASQMLCDIAKKIFLSGDLRWTWASYLPQWALKEELWIISSVKGC